MTTLADLDLNEAAKQATGNWKQFDCFVWFRASELDDADNWTVVYTHNRDSGLLCQSNAAAIDEALEQFSDADDPDIVAESHSHWACGWIDGYSIRVFKDGEITEAFKAYHELVEQLNEYPILNEEDLSRREYEATLENIGEAAWRLKRDFDLPEEWEAEVFDWLWSNRSHAVESTDDQGGWPEGADLEAAFTALGYQRDE